MPLHFFRPDIILSVGMLNIKPVDIAERAFNTLCFPGFDKETSNNSLSFSETVNVAQPLLS